MVITNFIYGIINKFEFVLHEVWQQEIAVSLYLKLYLKLKL